MKLPRRPKLGRKRQTLIAGLIAIALAVFAYAGTTSQIDSYAACVEAGFPVYDTNPPVCRDGLHNFPGTPVPSASPSGPVNTADYQLLVDGDTHTDDPPHEQVVINTLAEWQAYWRRVHAGQPTLPPIIEVDFASSSVVAVSLGRKPTGGFGVKITSIATSQTGSSVRLTETAPGEGCAVTQALTNRYLIVRTAKLAEPTSFRITNERRVCQ